MATHTGNGYRRLLTRRAQMPSKCANVKDEKRYKLKEQDMSKSRYLKRR